jgi:hypothetical protein
LAVANPPTVGQPTIRITAGCTGASSQLRAGRGADLAATVAKSDVLGRSISSVLSTPHLRRRGGDLAAEFAPIVKPIGPLGASPLISHPGRGGDE